MSRSLILRCSFAFLATVACLTVGCASSSTVVSNTVPKEVAEGSAKPAGFWGRMTSWMPSMPKLPTGAAPEEEIKNPGKLHLKYAQWRERVGDLVEARESYELALNDNPKSTDAILGLARLDQLNNRTYEAEQRYLSVLKIKPNDPVVLDAVGQFYASQERWDKATSYLTQAVQAAPRETSHRFNLAVALAKSGRINEAMPHFSQTVGDAEAHYNVGYILSQRNDLVGAERHLLQAVVARPDLAQAQQMLDDVRRSQADRAMFADRRPAVDGNPATATRTAAAGNVQPATGNYSPTQNGRGNRYQAVVPAASAQDASPQDYRQQYSQQQQQPAANHAPAQNNLNSRTAIPPWHTSPEFNRTSSGTYQPPQTQVPANGPPGSSQPTAEQLEQWRNQFAPAGNTPR